MNANKNLIFPLLLTLFIELAGPTFAMEPDNLPEKPPAHTCILSLEERFVREKGLGTLFILSDEMIIEIFKNLPLSTLGSLACTSQTISNFCEDSNLWKAMVTYLLPTLPQGEITSMDSEEAKQRIRTRNFFKEKDENYQVPMDLFKYLIRRPVLGTLGKKFEVTIGDESFIMEEPKLNPEKKDDNLDYPFFFMNFIFYTTKNIHTFPQDIMEGHKFLNTKPFFQHPKLKLLDPNDKIYFCAQPENLCFLSNFLLVFFNDNVSCKVIDKWQKEIPTAGHLIPITKNQQQEIEKSINYAESTKVVPGKALFIEGSFKIYKKQRVDK